jgi:hypothetical protein
VDILIGVDLHQLHTVNNNGHKDIEDMLHMVLVVPQVVTLSVVVMDV